MSPDPEDGSAHDPDPPAGDGGEKPRAGAREEAVGAEGRSANPGAAPGGMSGETLAEVLASIRALVSAEAAVRRETVQEAGPVLMLTPDMRITPEAEPLQPGAMLAEGLDQRDQQAPSAPIFDEEGLRRVINTLVREELQGELGERIGRNLRKLIRREIKLIEEEERDG